MAQGAPCHDQIEILIREAINSYPWWAVVLNSAFQSQMKFSLSVYASCGLVRYAAVDALETALCVTRLFLLFRSPCNTYCFEGFQYRICCQT